MMRVRRSFILPLLCWSGILFNTLLLKQYAVNARREARTTSADSSRSSPSSSSRLILRIEEYMYRRRGRQGMGDDGDGGNDDDDNSSRNRKEQSTKKKTNSVHSSNRISSAAAASQEELEMILQRDVHEEASIVDEIASMTSETSSDATNGTGNPSRTNPTSSAAIMPIKTTTRIVKFPQRLFRRMKHSVWESLDEMDRLIVTTTLPIATLFCILPLVNAGDVFWVSRLGDTLAVAAQQAGNQIYMSVFFLMNFLPSITAIQVSKSYASDDEAGTQDAICQALLLAFFVSAFGTASIFTYPQRFLSSILKDGAPALPLAIPYLRLRSISCLPMLFSFIGFSAFRGTMDVSSCIRITVMSSAMKMVLDPLLIHGFRLGITGSAIASLFSDWFAAMNYLKLLTDRRLIAWNKMTKLPPLKQMAPLIRGSLALQVRSLAMNLSQIYVTRKIHSLDDTGVSTAAFVLAMHTLSVGGVVLTALGMATQTLFPSTVENSPIEDRGLFVRALVGRFLKRGAGLGVAISVIQLLIIPGVLKSSPLPEVRSAAIVPMMLVIASQALNGIIQVAEGIIMGDGKFTRSSMNVVASTLGYLLCLRECPKRFGLTGVFVCMLIFTMLRLGTSLMYLPVIYKENDGDDGDLDIPTPVPGDKLIQDDFEDSKKTSSEEILEGTKTEINIDTSSQRQQQRHRF